MSIQFISTNIEPKVIDFNKFIIAKKSRPDFSNVIYLDERQAPLWIVPEEDIPEEKTIRFPKD